MAATMPSDSDKPYRGRRLSWAEFHRLQADRKADNDDDEQPPATPHRTTTHVAVR
jgi:hypothetical protein